MAKTREQKAVAVEQLTKDFKDAKSVAFADYHGLTVPQVDELRGKMRDANVRYVVAKKTLVNRAAKEAGYDLDAKQYQGMLGIAFGIEDEVAPAKVLGDMSKTTSVQILGGIFEGAVVDQEKMISLSKLPGKMELLGTVVGTIYAPVTSFVRILDAIRESSSAKASADMAREASEGKPAEEALAETSPSTEASGDTPQESTESEEAPVGAQHAAPEEEETSAPEAEAPSQEASSEIAEDQKKTEDSEKSES